MYSAGSNDVINTAFKSGPTQQTLLMYSWDYFIYIKILDYSSLHSSKEHESLYLGLINGHN